MPCTIGRRIACSAILVGTAIAACWGRSTRATQVERRAVLPGDEIVGEPRWQLTRAVTIAGPPAEVWPWLVQMGHPTQRAGWYAPYWFDRLVWKTRERSAEAVVPELQHLAVGDHVPDSANGSVFFTVDRLEPPRVLALLSTTHLLPPYTDIRFVWAFVLEELDGATRLLLRARAEYSPAWPRPVVWLFFHVVMNAGDFIEAGAILRGIKRRVERAASIGAGAT